MASTVLAALYALWIGYRLASVVPAISSTLANLGIDLTLPTRFIIGIPPALFLSAGALVAILLFVKDHYLLRDATRLQINAISAVLLAQGTTFAHAALMSPFIEILRSIR